MRSHEADHLWALSSSVLHYASGALLSAEVAGDLSLRKEATKSLGASEYISEGLVRQGHRVAFSSINRRDGFIYVRNRAISSRVNENFDHFGELEIASEAPDYGWRTFLGKPVFVNHDNGNHRKARGVNIAAALHEDYNPDGSPDTWVELLKEVDPKAYPKLAQALILGHVQRTSMGVDVGISTCSIPTCRHQASTEDELCKHMTGAKGARYSVYDPADGITKKGVVYEICALLRFFEDSLLVEPPADSTAIIINVEDRSGMKFAKVAHAESNSVSADEIADKVSPEGFTVHPYSGRVPRSGYQVAVPNRTEFHPGSILGHREAMARLIVSHRQNNSDLYRPGGHHYIGGWRAPHPVTGDDTLWLEPSERIGSRSEAVNKGRSNNQIEIWDNRKGEPISTGGTGGFDKESAYRLPGELGRVDGGTAAGRGSEDGGYLYSRTVGRVANQELGTAHPETFQPVEDSEEGYSLIDKKATKQEVTCAGLAVVAEDTGRILMLQRAWDDTDPASGKWEYPGGHIEEGESPIEAAIREWKEELGCELPPGEVKSSQIQPNGIYQLFVYVVPSEDILDINPDEPGVLNPDDPDHDNAEVAAWWLPKDIKDNFAVRKEVQGTDWGIFGKALKKTASDRADYGIPHSPSYGPPIHNLTEPENEEHDWSAPDDIYEHPQYYADRNGQADKESIAAIKAARGNDPERKVTIYRAAPRGVKEFNHGDWVTPSPTYASGHSVHATDKTKDWPVYKASVPAKHVRWAGDSINEFGYFGPSVNTTVHYRGGRNAESVDQPHEGSMKVALRRTAADEIIVPKNIDTMRDDTCPVCSSSGTTSGSRCSVCGYAASPSAFQDPDTSLAGKVRDQLGIGDPMGDACQEALRTLWEAPRASLEEMRG